MCLWVEVYVHVQGCLSSPLLYAELVWKMKPFGRISCRKIEEASVQNTTDRHIITYSIRIVMLWRHALMTHDNVLSLCVTRVSRQPISIFWIISSLFFVSGKIIRDTYMQSLRVLFSIFDKRFRYWYHFALSLISVTVATKIKKLSYWNLWEKNRTTHTRYARVLTSDSVFFIYREKTKNKKTSRQ